MMTQLKTVFVLMLLLWCAPTAYAQSTNMRVSKLAFTDSIIQLDSLSIDPNSFVLFCGETKLDSSYFTINYATSELELYKSCDVDFTAIYRVFPINFSETYELRDTSVIYDRKKGDREKFLISSSNSNADIFGGTGLSKSGSISRGVSFGNNQDLGVNSSLNLELAGQIAPNLKILASVTDDNLPIQPEGNTNQLREFDQVFIQVYNDRLKLVAGDFWLYKPQGYFMTYKKRSQGLTLDYKWSADTTRYWTSQFSGALSRGKFQRQNIQGVEGNQGPYRLSGAENEPFIIVLSGTERVYIDGRLLERGQDFDYTIDYNTAEVTFTSRNQITKDSRIVVEFQYSDQNYARSLFQTSNVYTSERLKFWFNAYSEQDAKNQSLQQELTFSQKQLLSNIGDSLDEARTSSIDSIGYFENQNLYKMETIGGVDSVLVYSINPDSAVYRATFDFVGTGNGDYLFSNFNALGRVFVYAGPNLGDYEPSRVIITPKQRQMVTTGVQYKIRPKLLVETEVAYTTNDLNTFSSIDDDDNKSIGLQGRLVGDVPLSHDSLQTWLMRTKIEIEARDKNFQPIENYRAVEFDRDWNTRGQGFEGNQLATSAGADIIKRQKGNINLEGQQYLIGTDYLGLRAATDGKWDENGFHAVWDGSYLSSNTDVNNTFLRHRGDVSQSLGPIKVGYRVDQEQNLFRTSVLDPSSYSFFDYQFYIANGDSIKNSYKLFYRERIDKKSDSVSLVNAAKARTIGGEVAFTELKNQTLNVVASYRELEVSNPTLINATPENTLLGRIEYSLRAWKGAFTWSTFYEAGSGLELKREFLYIKVNDGQGVYTWIDYNNDGIKDLNEFEIAQFVDQASYIRVFVPSNEYVQTYSNEFNQSIYLRPSRVWSTRKGVLKLASHFSDQARVRIRKKIDYLDLNEAFNPFALSISDTNLISSSVNIRNTLFFNRTSSIFGADYSYQNVSTKSLLATGFDSRLNESHKISTRLNLKRKFTIKVSGTTGYKASEADYTSGRNYDLKYVYLEPSVIYQPNTVFRVSLDFRGSEKRNSEALGGELSTVLEVGSTLKFNQVKRGSFQANFNVVSIRYDGAENSALGFEMLEGLKPGVNYTWNMGYQRTVSKNLQLSVQYNGRQSEGNRTIHSGGMEVRAFF